MIIGNGDIASILKSVDREDRIYFASGVSNSSELRESEYQREIDLFLTLLQGPSISPLHPPKRKHVVYFSSLCIFYSDSRYAQHKKKMEKLVRDLFKFYTIIRMGNITWGKNNPHTLINFIKNKMRNREPFDIQDVYRYIVDKDEFLHWIEMIPDFSCDMNITGRRMKVKDIVKEYCWPWAKESLFFVQEEESIGKTFSFNSIP